jgi:hypothetical protein
LEKENVDYYIAEKAGKALGRIVEEVRSVNTGYWVLGTGYSVLGIRYWVLGIGYSVLGIRYWVLGIGVYRKSA